MKGESRQHGMVRSYMIMPTPFNQKPDSKVISRFEHHSAVGLVTRVTGKPANHSRFAGKCGRWKSNGGYTQWAACKSNSKGVKGKGVSSKMSGGKGQYDFAVTGVSATEALGRLMSANDYWDDGSEDYEEDQEEEIGEVYYESVVGSLHVAEEEEQQIVDPPQRIFEVVEDEVGDEDEDLVDEDGEEEDDDHDDLDDFDDDGMSFCEVGFVVDQLDEDGDGGEDGWCLVDDLL